MKIIYGILIVCLLPCCSHSRPGEEKIRRSIDKYLVKIKVPADTRKNYDFTVDTFTSEDYIVYLRNENMQKCNLSAEEKAQEIIDDKRTAEKGMPLPPPVLTAAPLSVMDAYMKIDDSLAKIPINKDKKYYKVTTFYTSNKDTLWQNTFWLNHDYKVVN